ncbi:MAG: proton-conducting transporter membrane subunit [Trebonia sp.]|uniref:proton-conducting transporter transmembrane domain-containing protein n=1 Tax=Trebonia sp. TaxID=2767075 RepID=UPI003C75BA5D
MTAVPAAGFILLAMAAASGLVITAPGWPRGVPYVAGAAGAGCLAVAGGFALAGRTVTLNVAGWLGDPLPGQQALGLAADRLSGLFLVMAFGAAAGVSVAFASWAVRPDRPAVFPRMLAAGYALALGSVAVVMTATDAFTALFGWEALTVAFYLLAGANARDRDRAGAARITVAFGKVSGAALLIGLLLLAVRSHSIALASFAHVPGGAARTTALVLLLAGFAVKAGLVPFQVWLPRGYAAAPGPARAVMAGVCVNVGFYGMWRTLALLGRPPGWLAGVLLLLGGLTALLGIAHAAVSSRLSRVIAYSSVENTGLIVTGFGVALTGAAVGDRRLIAVGLLAATLQMVAHTAAKSLLFCSSAGLEATAGGADDLEVLRGVGRRAPWSGWGLAVGAMTLAGLPPTAGFVSEWFLLESLMQQFRVTALAGRLTLALAGAAVALTIGFAGVTFVRLVGMVVLGPGGSGTRGGDYGWTGRVAIALLSACPLALAALTPLEIRVIAAGLSPAVPGALTMGALKSPWVLQPVFAGFSILSPSWLWVELPVMLGLVGLLALGMSGRRLLRVRRVPAWHSATMGVAGPDSYTAFGYANPTRRVLASVLHTQAEVVEVVPDGDGVGDGDQVPHLRYASDVVEVVETWLYRPVIRVFGVAVACAKRLQSGRLDAYLLYMLIALVAVVAVVTALA